MNTMSVWWGKSYGGSSPFFWYVPPNSSDETFSLEDLLRIIVQVIETEQGWFLVVLSYLRKFHWVLDNTLFRTEQHYILGILICQDESNFSASCIIPFSSTMITAAGLTQTIRRRVNDSDCSFLWQEAITVSLKVDSFEFLCYQFSPDTWFSASLIAKSIYCVIKSGFTWIFLLSI